MSLFVNTNVSALQANRQLFNSGAALDVSFQRLSSGFRINSASDDAAGLQISDRMTSQIQGLDQAVRNANDGISVAQTAEGALSEITTALQRMRQLAVQAENGINSSADKVALQKEVSALKSEISRIASTTEFAGQTLLDGTYSASFLVGANSGQTIRLGLTKRDIADGFFESNYGMALLDITSPNTSALLIQGSTTIPIFVSNLEYIDESLSIVNSIRADLGAIQNRFQSTIRNLSNISENVSSARSRIRDTDFAQETAELTRNQIIQQASTTVLAQANTRPQSALNLLGA